MIIQQKEVQTIGKDIAKYYTDKDGNLKVEKMNADLSRASRY